MKQPYKVHMLPTDSKNAIYKDINGVLYLSNPNGYRGKYQHIYITSDEEIKDGEWGLDTLSHTGIPYIFQVKRRVQNGSISWYEDVNYKLWQISSPTKHIFKIVATTNKELWRKKHPHYTNTLMGDDVSKIPTSLIEEYVKQPFDEVMLEMNVYEDEDCLPAHGGSKYQLKLTPAGEVIWSKKEGKMYTSEQVLNILLTCNTYCEAISFPTKKDIIEWFDKNYPK